MARIKREGGENMLEVKKVTKEDPGSKKNRGIEGENLSNPPCHPEAGNCSPVSTCPPNRPCDP